MGSVLINQTRALVMCHAPQAANQSDPEREIPNGNASR